MGDRAAEAAKARATSQSLMQAKIKALRLAKQQQQKQDQQSQEAPSTSSVPNSTNLSSSSLLAPTARIGNGRSQLQPGGSDSRTLTWFGVEDDEDGEDGEEGQTAEGGHQGIRAARQSSSSSSSSWQRSSMDDEDDGTILGHDSPFPNPPPRDPEDESPRNTFNPSNFCSTSKPSPQLQLSPKQNSEDSVRASVLLAELERDLLSAGSSQSSRPEHNRTASTNTFNSITSSKSTDTSSSLNTPPIGPPSGPLPSLPAISIPKRLANQSNRMSGPGSPIGPPPSFGLPPLPSSPSSRSLSSPVNGQFSSQVHLDLRRSLRPGSSGSGSNRSSFEGSPSSSSPRSSLVGGRRSSSSRSPLASIPTGSDASIDSIDEDDDALESVLGMGQSPGDGYQNGLQREGSKSSTRSQKNREFAFGPRSSSSNSPSSNSSPSPSEISLRPSSPSSASLPPYSNSNAGLGIALPTDGGVETEEEKRRKSLMRKSMGSLMNALSDETDQWRNSETGPFGVESGNETETDMGRHGHEDERRPSLSARGAGPLRERENSAGGSSSNGSGSMLGGNLGRPLTSFSTNTGIYNLYSSAAASKSGETVSSLNSLSPNLSSPLQGSSPTFHPPQPTPIVTIDAVDSSSGSDSDSDRDGPRKRRKAKKNKWAFEDQRAAPSRQGSMNSIVPSIRSVSSKGAPPVPNSNPSDYSYYQFAPDLPPFVPQGMRPKDLTGAGTWQSIVARAAAAGSFTGPSTPAGFIRDGAMGHGVHRESTQSFQSAQSLQSNQSSGPVSMRKLAADARKRQAEQAQAQERQASQYSQLTFSPFELHAHASNASHLAASSRPESSQSVYSAASSNNSANFSSSGLSPVESAIYSQGLPAFNVSGHFPSALAGPHFRDSSSEFGTITARSSTSTLHGLGIQSSSSSPTLSQSNPPVKVYAEMSQQTSPTSSASNSPRTSTAELKASEDSPVAAAGEARKTTLSEEEDTEGEKTKSKRDSRTLTPTKRLPPRRRSTMGQTETAAAKQRNSRLSSTHKADDLDAEPISWNQIKAPRLSSRKSNIGTSPRGAKFSSGFLLPPSVSNDLIGSRTSTTSARSVSIYSTTSEDDDKSSSDDSGSEESDLDVGTALEDLAERSGALDGGARGAKRKLREKVPGSPSHAPILGSRPISSLPSRTKALGISPTSKPFATKQKRANHRRERTGWSSDEGGDGDDEERENNGEATAIEIDESEAEQKPKTTGSATPLRNRNGPRPSAPAILSTQAQAARKLSPKPFTSTPTSSSKLAVGSRNSNNLVLRKAASSANVSTASWRRSHRVESSRPNSPEFDLTSQAEGSDDDDWLSKDVDEKEMSRIYNDENEPKQSTAEVAPVKEPDESASNAKSTSEEKLEEAVSKLNIAAEDEKPPVQLVSSPQDMFQSPEISKAVPISPQLPSISSDQTAMAVASDDEASSRDTNSNLLRDGGDSGDMDLDGTPNTILGSSWSRADGSNRNSAATSATSNWSEGEGSAGKHDSSDGNQSAGKARGSGESDRLSRVKAQVGEERRAASLDSQSNSNDEKSSVPKVKSPGISASLDTPSKPMRSKLMAPTPRSSLPTPSSGSKLSGSSSPSTNSSALPTPISKLKPRGSVSGLRQPQAKARPSLPIPTTTKSKIAGATARTSSPVSGIALPSPSIRRMKSFGDQGSSTFVPPPNSTLPKLITNSAIGASRSPSALGKSSIASLSSPSASTPPSSWTATAGPVQNATASQILNRKSSSSSLSNRSGLPRLSGLPMPSAKKV